MAGNLGSSLICADANWSISRIAGKMMLTFGMTLTYRSDASEGVSDVPSQRFFIHPKTLGHCRQGWTSSLYH